ncbi:MAG: hypothetical protein LBI29_01750 [Rickettsiales bacterium]|nr:hypothetical protein [Rickettsiales bacterium]
MLLRLFLGINSRKLRTDQIKKDAMDISDRKKNGGIVKVFTDEQWKYATMEPIDLVEDSLPYLLLAEHLKK